MSLGNDFLQVGIFPSFPVHDRPRPSPASRPEGHGRDLVRVLVNEVAGSCSAVKASGEAVALEESDQLSHALDVLPS